jgi:hypothetical protein
MNAVTSDELLKELRAFPANGFMLRAADEIERLRRMLLAEENATDIYRIENEHLQKDRNNAVLRAEEAERMLGLYREWIGDEMLAAARKKAGL